MVLVLDGLVLASLTCILAAHVGLAMNGMCVRRDVWIYTRNLMVDEIESDADLRPVVFNRFLLIYRNVPRI